MLGEAQGRIWDALAQRAIERGARRYLQQLLPSALERALPFPEMHYAPLAVAEDLHFDMARRQERLL